MSERSERTNAHRPKARDRSASFGCIALLLATLTAWLSAPQASAAVGAGAVQITIDDVRPNSPALSTKPQPLAVAMTLTNTTALTLVGVSVSGARGDPISTLSALDSAIARPKPPTASQAQPFQKTLTRTLAPRSAVRLVFRIRTDIPTDAELCLCANAIYPLYFTAKYTADDVTSELGTAQTFLPSFTVPPAKAQVGWLWPLLDRPHRSTKEQVFTDDDLADEVRSGGRLDQLLTVVEKVAASQVPLTLVTDPDLIDELAVMSGIDTTGTYRVQTVTGRVPGAGSDAATAWLQRLRRVLDAPSMELDFTPLADPAVESLARNGLSWSVGLTTTAQARVTEALGAGRTPLSDIAWPAGRTLSPSTLSTLVAQGTKTVVVSDRTLTRGTLRSVDSDALAPVQAGVGEAVAAVTSTPIEHWVSAVLQPGGEGLAALPQLVAQLAIRVVTSLDRSHYVVVAPPRNLTVDPAIAVRTILATSLSSWASPLPLRAAASSITPVDHGLLRSPVAAPQLPPATIRSLRYVTDTLPTVGVPGAQSFYRVANPTTAQLAAWPTAMQRCESTSLLFRDPRDSITRARRLERRISGILLNVSLVPPSFGTYTLTSKKSDLPVTVVNRLPDDVQVKINIRTLFGRPGFIADNDKVVIRSIRGGAKVQFRIPAHVDSVGRFDIQVSLSTPDGVSLGKPIDKLTVRSTALGTIGVVITIAAAVVLVLALLGRFVRRMTGRRRRKRPAPVATAP